MSEMIIIGQIGKHHNQYGEVKCQILSDFPERFMELERVFLEKDDDIKRLHIENVWFDKSYAILKFTEIDDIVEAEALGGYYVKIPEAEAVELPEGHYFIHQLIDLDVYTDTGEHLGMIDDVLTTGSNDVYVVKQRKKEILLPAIHDVVKEIDLENRKITVHILEGLLD